MDILNKKGTYMDTNICKCIDTPSDLFVKGNTYRWGYCIDGYVIFLENGKKIDFGDIEFYWYFQIISGYQIKECGKRI